MELLDRFKERLIHTNREAILFDRKVDVQPSVTTASDADDAPEPQHIDNESTTEPTSPSAAAIAAGRLDLDAEDEPGDDWMKHKFVAPDEDKSVSRAKDANLRETSEDWYDISDPRNLMNQRRRAAADASGASAPKQFKQ